MAFTRPNTTQTPDELYDTWLPVLSNAELRVLLYIVRHTLGYSKKIDAISLKQFTEGIKRRKDGKRVDGGCGIKSKPHVRAALESLEQKDLICRFGQTMANGADAATRYKLKFDGDEDEEGDCPLDAEGGSLQLPPGVAVETPGGSRGSPRGMLGASRGGIAVEIPGGVAVEIPGGGSWGDPTINNVTRNNVQQTTIQETTTHLEAADAAAGVQEETDANGEARSPTDEGRGGVEQLVLMKEVRVPKDPMKEQEPKKTRAAKKAKEATHSSSSVGEREEKRPQGQKKGVVREGVEHQEGESPEDFAAREYLARVRGWTSCGRPVYVRWRMDLAPIVEQTGEEGFRDWITWLLSDPWFKENAYILKPPRLLQEFEDWWNKPEPRPLRRKGWAPKRDDGRVENNESRVEERFVCVACNGELGTRHQDFCTLVKRGVVRAGSPITREHCDEKWAIAVLHDSRRRGAV